MTDDPPVLDQINLVVADMAASSEFYRRLGLKLGAGMPAWEDHHREASRSGGVDMDLDSGVFARHWNRGWPPGRTGPVIGFRVASREAVDRLFEELTGAGHRALQEPYEAFWGARYAVVEDPDGNAVGLMSPVDPARRRAPPDPATLA